MADRKLIPAPGSTPTGGYGYSTSGPYSSGYSGGSSVDQTLGKYGLSSQGLNAGAFSVASSKPIPTDYVFVGHRALGITTPTKGHDTGRLGGGITYDAAQNLPGQWYANDQNFYKQFITKAIMYKLPGASPDMGLPEAGAAWDNLLQTAIQLTKSTGRNWTPWEVMESYNHKPGTLGTHRSGDWIIDNATGEKVKYVGPKSRTTTQTSVDLTDPETAQALITQSLTQLLGRAPSDGELAQFKGTISGYEKSHPSVATTTEQYDSQGNVVATNTTRSGGVTDAARQQLLQSKVQDTPEYAKYQAGTTYFNALLQLIGGG